jgi:hypothetical protein
MAEIVFMGTMEVFGDPIFVVSKTKVGAQRALFKYYRDYPDRTTDFKTWAEFEDQFGPWIISGAWDQIMHP